MKIFKFAPLLAFAVVGLVGAGCQQTEPDPLGQEHEAYQRQLQQQWEQQQQEQRPQQQSGQQTDPEHLPDHWPQGQPSSQEPAGQEPQQSEIEQFFRQGQQQLSETENAIRNLDQIAAQLGVEQEYAEYSQALQGQLEVARQRLEGVRHADPDRVDVMGNQYVMAINELINLYEEAATTLQGYFPAEPQLD